MYNKWHWWCQLFIVWVSNDFIYNIILSIWIKTYYDVNINETITYHQNMLKAVRWPIIVNFCIILVSCGELSHWQSYHIFFLYQYRHVASFTLLIDINKYYIVKLIWFVLINLIYGIPNYVTLLLLFITNIIWLIWLPR